MQSSILQQNYFQLLGLPIAFELDRKNLEVNYLKLQTKFHPDRYMNASPQEKRMVMQLSAHLNQARGCLLDDVKRAKYLLELSGVHIADEHTIDDMDFLMQQMEWREQAADLKNSKSTAETSGAEKFIADIQQEKIQYAQQFEDMYEQKEWPQAKLLIAKMQFIQKLLKELKI